MPTFLPDPKGILHLPERIRLIEGDAAAHDRPGRHEGHAVGPGHQSLLKRVEGPVLEDDPLLRVGSLDDLARPRLGGDIGADRADQPLYETAVHEIEPVSRQGALDHGEGGRLPLILPYQLADGRARAADAAGEVHLHPGTHEAPYRFVEVEHLALSVFFRIAPLFHILVSSSSHLVRGSFNAPPSIHSTRSANVDECSNFSRSHSFRTMIQIIVMEE